MNGNYVKPQIGRTKIKRDAHLYEPKRRFTKKTIREAVDLVVEYNMTYREAVYVMRTRGVSVALVTLHRWVNGRRSK